MSKKTKGINCCGECVYYSFKKHKCTRGFHEEGTAQDRFFTDCDPPDVQPVKHGEWIFNHMCCEDCYYDGKCDFCAHDSDYNHMSLNSICSYCSCRAEK